MGIDLGDIVVKRPSDMGAFQGRRIAFDAWNILYQFLSAIRQGDGTPLRDAQGRTTSHLAGILNRMANVVAAGVRPVWVFDGEPHPLKRETLMGRTLRRDQAETDYAAAVEAGDMERARSKAQQTSRMTPEMATQAQALLRALGIPVVQAPRDGEAQAAWMCQEGLVDAVCSQDFDALLYGTPLLVRNLTVTGRRKQPGRQVWSQVHPETIGLQESLEALGMGREALVDVALLVGTDFHPGVKGIGAKKAVQLVKKAGGLEPLLERLAGDPGSADSAVERAIVEQHEALAERDTVRRIFLQPEHTADGIDAADITPSRPDAAAVRALLVDEHGFLPERVDTALVKFGAAAKPSQQSLFDF